MGLTAFYLLPLPCHLSRSVPEWCLSGFLSSNLGDLDCASQTFGHDQIFLRDGDFIAA
jgi:hypothetical protein